MKKNLILISIMLGLFLLLLSNCQQPSGGSSGGSSGHGGNNEDNPPSTGNIEQNIITTIDGDGTPPTNVGSYSAIAAAGNNIYVSYFDIDNMDLKFAKSTDKGKNWTTTTIDSAGNVGLYSSIATSGNNIYIAYRDQNNRRLKLLKSLDAGVTWAEKVVDIGDAGYDTSIVVSGSNIYISYRDFRDPSNPVNSRLKFAKSTDYGDTWPAQNIKIVDDSQNVGHYSSISTSGNNIYISYYDQPNGSLKFAKSTDRGDTWLPGNKTTLDDRAGLNTGYDTSIGVVGSNIYISYYFAGSGILMLAKSINEGTDWTIQEIDNNGVVGSFTSLEVSGSNIYVSYRSSTGNDLKFIKSIDGGTNWTKKIVDSDITGETDDVGYYTSIAVSGNYVYISYYDETNADLKFAKSIDGGDTW